MNLWEILVPTTFGDNQKPVRTKHHKQWDEKVREISGGLTILKPAKGQWVDKSSNKLYEERIIPVRVACTRQDIEKIIDFTIRHYRQIAVMCYKISDEVIIEYA